MNQLDPEVKKLRLYVDQHLAELRIMVENLHRVVGLFQKEVEGIQDECKRRNNLEEPTGNPKLQKLTTMKSGGVIELLGTSLSRYGSVSLGTPNPVQPRRFKKS